MLSRNITAATLGAGISTFNIFRAAEEHPVSHPGSTHTVTEGLEIGGDVNKPRIGLILIVFLTASLTAKAQNVKDRFVGKSPCAAETLSERPDFSIRIDKAQRTDLVNRNLPNSKVLLIVQYKNEADHCGVILDAIEIQNMSKDFQFSCFDPLEPGAVVVGTRNTNDSRVTAVAIEAWRIDLKKETFNKDRHKVKCSYESGAGEDDGSDLVDAAKKRAAQESSGQNAKRSEP